MSLCVHNRRMTCSNVSELKLNLNLQRPQDGISTCCKPDSNSSHPNELHSSMHHVSNRLVKYFWTMLFTVFSIKLVHALLNLTNKFPFRYEVPSFQIQRFFFRRQNSFLEKDYNYVSTVQGRREGT